MGTVLSNRYETHADAQHVALRLCYEYRVKASVVQTATGHAIRIAGVEFIEDVPPFDIAQAKRDGVI